jgi:undecaprenyl-diphosphatase
MWRWPERAGWPGRAAPAGPAAGRLARWVDRDLRWALALHRMALRPGAVVLLGSVSRLGDGAVWVATLLALLVLGGSQAWVCGMQMAVAATANLAIYWTLKHRVARPRPFVTHADIRCCVPPLDRFSFPSGHTLHAVAFATLLSWHYPAFGSLLWGGALLVALSRVVLGLHYPSDVMVGAAIGATTAGVMLMVWS